MKLTLKFKLKYDTDIIKTMFDYTAALNYVSSKEFNLNSKITNPVELSKKYYSDIRDKFGLPAQHTCSIFRDIAAAYKASRTKKHKLKNPIYFKRPFFSVVRNRSFSFDLNKLIVKITTNNGRKSFDIKLSDYHRRYINNSISYCDSTVSQDRKGRIYLNLTINIPETEISTNGNTMGIDIGLTKFATCCTNNGKTLVINGGSIKDKRIKFLNLRKRLQHKGTLSAKRLLRKLSGRENRWMRNANFCAIKAIINFAKENNVSYIGIEDLTNIRNSSKKLSKNLRRTINSWAFYQFKEILCYKTKMNGISVIQVDPRFTSQACSKCGYVNKENRKSQKCFKCLSCGYTHNADINAASNIELLTRITRSNELSRGAINHPYAKDVDSKGLFRQLRTSLTCKLTSLYSE